MSGDKIIQNGALYDAYQVEEKGNILTVGTLISHAHTAFGVWCEGRIFAAKEINQLLLAVSRLIADGFPIYLFFPEDHRERPVLQERLGFYGLQEYGHFIPSPEKPEDVFPECLIFPAESLGSLYLRKADILLKNNNQTIYQYLRANICTEGER